VLRSPSAPWWSQPPELPTPCQSGCWPPRPGGGGAPVPRRPAPSVPFPARPSQPSRRSPAGHESRPCAPRSPADAYAGSCSHTPLQIGLDDQLAAPLLSRLRDSALGLRLRHEVAPRADVGILVRRGIHRRDVPNALEPQNATGPCGAVVLVLLDCKGKAHLVHVTATDQFIQVPARRRVGQLRPHQ